MNLGKLTPSKGSVRTSKRIGRGNATGQGRTAGKGHKGYQSRSGTKAKFHFEGGQTPLMRRLPKRGFSNYGFRKEVQIVNLERIAQLEVDQVTPEILFEKGVVKKADVPVKVLGNGEVTKAIEITADSFSKSAVEKLEKAGGKAIFK
ncbi:MAG: 50S ribosomal protein L15 [Candidatus Marinimicrobia bacterium]|jgi:large subunit ribosomal protein L15|nr:50S ribosomal protein L15 [Candidatus Neomarinimicrobiota bacterium]MDP6853344.1 50S ribosomal protein L15 [Candidatus Neomarinimicrobiota bacterium]MDP6936316.1 50S ribosomal protein L15 [Candidatus Neomarinimicrobiota bacterium]